MPLQGSLYLQNGHSLRIKVNIFPELFHIYTFVSKNRYFYY